MELAKKMLDINKRIIIGLMAFAIAGALTLSAQGANATEDNEVIVESTEVTYDIAGAKDSAKEKDVAKLQIVGNYRTVSAAKIKAAKKAGKCKSISGSQAIKMGVVTQGYMGSGVGYAQENRQTTMCDTNNDGKYDVRAECGNKLKVTHAPKPKEAKATVWVNNFGSAVAKIKASVKVKAKAKCETETASASAFARAVGKVSISVKVKTITSANGKVKGSELAKVKAKAVANASASAKAKAKAKAKASAHCKSVTVTTTTTKPAPKPPKPTPHPKPTPTPTTPTNTTTTSSSDTVEEGKGSVKEADELPNTGPGAVIASFVGVSSFASVAFSAVTRRFGL